MVGVTLGIYTAARMGLAASLSDDVERLTGRPPIPFGFIHDTRAAWIPTRAHRGLVQPRRGDRVGRR